ncbi:MAG: dihydroneopterin aldolase [Rubrobacter sp.]|nr:dihydroneopterin aldolase [Rubrobacter sp.]
MHDRFTHSGWRVVVLAGEEARGLGHRYIGTEHLLLGLLGEQKGVVARALKALGVTPGKAREQVICVVGSRVADVEDYRLPLTPRARKVLEVALKEALGLGYDHVGAEHILLGLVGQPQSIAAQVLYKLGANPDVVHREVVRLLDRWEKSVGGVDRTADPLHAAAFRARVEGLKVQARCGVTDEERAKSQALRVDLDYLYEAAEGEDLLKTVDYGVLIEGVAELLEREEFRLLETAARMVGEYALGRFPSVREVTVTVTKLRVPVAREVSGVSVETTLGR